VFSLIRKTLSHPEASKLSFGLIQELASSQTAGSVTSENFGGLVAVLDDFASVAGLTIDGQKRKDKRVPPTAV